MSMTAGSVNALDFHSTKIKIPCDAESKNSRTHTDYIKQLPLSILLTLARKGLESLSEDEKQKIDKGQFKITEPDASGFGNQTIESYEITLSKLQNLIVEKSEQFKKAESENRVWKAEKLALKSTIDDLKYQLQFRNCKNKSNKTDDTLKLKKKLKDYEKKLLKMKQQSLQNDYLQFETQIDKTLNDLNEFSNHWRNPSPKLLCHLKEWKDAKRNLPLKYSEAKASLSNHMKTLEKGKDIPDFDSILASSIGFQLPESPNLLQLTQECQQIESNVVPSPSVPDVASLWDDTDYQSMSADSASSYNSSVTNQVVNILLKMDLGYSKEKLIMYTEDYIRNNPSVKKLDPDDISAEVVLFITSGM